MNEWQRAKSGGLLDGRIAGVRIGFNWSWLFVFALIVWSLAGSYFPSRYPSLSGGAYLVMAVYAAILFFASLLLHELGHAVAPFAPSAPNQRVVGQDQLAAPRLRQQELQG